ncbi:hypothetical protein [Paenirhodobacter sp.]|uniref:hypothetical protein n=1 Tax=Paenirhodobacter sp. TaxID=1965326 RepID=UPI003B3E9364
MTGDFAFIRTTRFGPAEDLLAQRLERTFGAGNVAVCVDESRGPVGTGRWPKTALTPARAEALVGGPLPPDWGWRMGDLCHMAVAESFGPKARQWLVESDVYLPPDAAEIFTRLGAIEADFLACDLRRKKVKPIAEAVTLVLPTAEWGCIFALNRLAGGRIAALRTARRAVVAALAGQKRKMPNDEAMVANLGAASGWMMADLYTVAPEVFSPHWFATNPPNSTRGDGGAHGLRGPSGPEPGRGVRPHPRAGGQRPSTALQPGPTAPNPARAACRRCGYPACPAWQPRKRCVNRSV